MSDEPTVAADKKLAVDSKQPSITRGPELVDGKPVVGVKVYSPFKVYFDEPAFSISAENDTGPFDILPHHHNFMTLLNACELSISSARGQEEKIKITRGVMHVKQDKITVFLDV